MKRIAFIVVIIVAIASGAALYGILQSPKTETPSQDTFIDAITDAFPLFLKDDKPVIQVVDIKNTDETWYIITLKSIHEEVMSVPVRVVFTSANSSSESNRLNLLLGPGTHFTEAELLRYNVPDSVIMELQKT